MTISINLDIVSPLPQVAEAIDALLKICRFDININATTQNEELANKFSELSKSEDFELKPNINVVCEDVSS